MSKERELLNLCAVTFKARNICPLLLAKISKHLAQPEQEPEFNFDLERMKAAIESPISDVTVDDLIKQPEQTEQEPIAWILKETGTGYKTQVAWRPSVLKKGWEAIPLYPQTPLE